MVVQGPPMQSREIPGWSNPQGPSVANEQPTPQQLAEKQQRQEAELLAKCQRIYSDYAHSVRLLEESTTHINASKIIHRQRFYWLPLQKYNQEVMSQQNITFVQLADIVNTGQEQKWPTQDPKDGEYIARMLRRIPTERAIANRRMIAAINMAALDAWCDSIVAQLASNSPRGPVLPSAPIYSGGITAPIHPDGTPATLPSSFRFGSITVKNQ